MGLADQIALILENPDAALVSAGTGVARGSVLKADETVLCFGGSLVGVPEYRGLILEELKARGHLFRYVEFVADVTDTGAIGMAKSHSALAS